MSDIVAVVYNNDITASVTSTGTQAVVSAVGIQGASGTKVNLEYANNVDASNLENGSILIYNNNSSIWVASRHLEAQDMDAGEF